MEKKLNKDKKQPLKKMGKGDFGEKDTRLTPYIREKINPRNWEDFVEDEDDLDEIN